MNSKQIVVTTPISHIDGLVELLETKGTVHLKEFINKKDLKNFLLSSKSNCILCNPNRQDYKIDRELLEGSNIEIINTCSTGLNHIDIEYCNQANIKVLSLTKDYELINNLPSTAELAFGLLLDLLRSITVSNNEVKKNMTWDYTKFIGTQVKDLKIGIIGCGRLGSKMKKYCEAFDAKVFIYDPYKKENNVDSLEDLFDICDAVSLHVHVTPETTNLIDYQLLSKNVKYLVNTSRGEIVVEKDVVRALKEKKLLGYGTDVLSTEFGNIQKSIFFNKKNSYLNTIITPHTGGMTKEGQKRAYEWAINKF